MENSIYFAYCIFHGDSTMLVDGAEYALVFLVYLLNMLESVCISFVGQRGGLLLGKR